MEYFGIEAGTREEAAGILRARIGGNLAALRSMRDLSIAQAAEQVGGITPDTLRNYELGKTGITYENAWLLADFYRVPIGALAGRIAYEKLA